MDSLEVRRRSNVWRACAKAFKGAIREHCEATGDTEDDVVELLGGCVSKSHLNNMANGHAPVAADILIQLRRRLHVTTAMEALCRLAGGTYVEDSRGDLTSNLAAAIKEIGDWTGEMGRMLEDGRVEPHELHGASREFAEMLTRAHGLMAQCEAAAQVHQALTKKETRL